MPEREHLSGPPEGSGSPASEERTRRITFVEAVAAVTVAGTVALIVLASTRQNDRAPLGQAPVVVVQGSGVLPDIVSGSAGSGPREDPRGVRDSTTANASIADPQRRFRGEARDPLWAARSEVALRDALLQTGLRSLPIAIRCGTSLCEISGAIPVDASEAARNAAMLALQDSGAAAAIGEAGLADLDSGAIEGDPSDARRILFRRYVARR